MRNDPAWDAFCKSVPEELRDDVLTKICEAAHGDKVEGVHILERDQIDAINVRACGSIDIGGVEYSFHCESGDRNGFVLESWDDDKEFKHHEPTRWTLKPNSNAVAQHISNGTEAKLLKVWGLFLKRPDVAKIASSYTYDKRFAPGLKTERYWRDAAAKFGLVLTTQDDADELRKQLRGKAS